MLISAPADGENHQPASNQAIINEQTILLAAEILRENSRAQRHLEIRGANKQ